ncbi:putative ribosomal protein L30 [Lupinus albus]|uniref:Putative ribosomal protein L30 n=1 Tax=Lupinus albus TaxID=3870 RepID=A0A6A4NAY2_LUPAL|nr:putative ribosomal protein L30 [Lupinus albus]
MSKEEVKSVVLESVLKKKKRNEEWALVKTQELEAIKTKRVASRKLIFIVAKLYAKEYDEYQKCFLVRGRKPDDRIMRKS